MRVLNLSNSDYANYSHDNARALRSIGIDCRDACIHPHVFKYKTSSQVVELHEIEQAYKKYDCVQIFHSDVRLYQLVKSHPNIIVYHTGTKYRQQPEFHDEVFQNCKIATDQCEFLLKKDMHYIAPHVEMSVIQKRKRGKLIIGHFPSLPDAKGTNTIERLLRPFVSDFEIRIDKRKLTHPQHLKRVSECHIYVELFSPYQNGKPYGCFGTSAFEATAMGGLVITNNINRSAYESVYGQQPFLTPNTERDFKSLIAGLTDKNEYFNALEICREGFHEKHSIENTGKRILNFINESR